MVLSADRDFSIARDDIGAGRTGEVGREAWGLETTLVAGGLAVRVGTLGVGLDDDVGDARGWVRWGGLTGGETPLDGGRDPANRTVG